MAVNMEFATIEARLKSFEPPTKRSKAGWPHKAPSAQQVAEAGFYYKPYKTGDDNVACYLCDRRLDGWEKDDDPIEEHLKHSPECGYATLMNIAREAHYDTNNIDDPTSASIEQARRATFEAGWPHESKRGWTCKTEQMVQAGWHFTPTAVSEDFASCAYCNLSLDGWEPKDNPFEEHHRRAPDCVFFVFAGTTAPSKRPKAKQGRASRSSRVSRSSRASTRLSTQSNVTLGEDIPDLDDSIDTSSTSIASNMSKASTASRSKRKAAGGAKSSRSKKAKIEPEPEPVPEPEAVDIVEEPAVPDVDETIDHSTTSMASMMSTASTATTKGRKKTAPRVKMSKAKKTKAARSTKTKKAEPEPAREPEPQIKEPMEVEGVIEEPEDEVAPNEPEVIDFAEPASVEDEPELSSIVHEAPIPSPPHPEVQYPELARAAAGSPLQHKSSPYPNRSSPHPEVHAHTSPLAAEPSPQRSPSIHSPSNSDIENAPPSSLPPSSRPPHPQTTPSRTRITSTWTPVDVELVFQKTPGASLNLFDMAKAEELSVREQDMTVQEWIEHIAELAEQNLRQEGERVVGVFEKEGARAMHVLEAVECI